MELKQYSAEEIRAEYERRNLGDRQKTLEGKQPGTSSENKEHNIICSVCGNADTVPFKPREGWTVKCRECYKQGKA